MLKARTKRWKISFALWWGAAVALTTSVVLQHNDFLFYVAVAIGTISLIFQPKDGK